MAPGEPKEPIVEKKSSKQQLENQHTKVELSSHSGPLPSPTDLQRYEQIVPGVAARLVDAMFKEQDFRQASERELIELEKSDSKRSYRIAWAALSVPLILAVAVLVSVFRDNSSTAMWATIGGMAVALVNAAINLGRKKHGSATADSGQSDPGKSQAKKR